MQRIDGFDQHPERHAAALADLLGVHAQLGPTHMDMDMDTRHVCGVI